MIPAIVQVKLVAVCPELAGGQDDIAGFAEDFATDAVVTPVDLGGHSDVAVASSVEWQGLGHVAAHLAGAVAARWIGQVGDLEQLQKCAAPSVDAGVSREENVLTDGRDLADAGSDVLCGPDTQLVAPPVTDALAPQMLVVSPSRVEAVHPLAVEIVPDTPGVVVKDVEGIGSSFVGVASVQALERVPTVGEQDVTTVQAGDVPDAGLEADGLAQLSRQVGQGATVAVPVEGTVPDGRAVFASSRPEAQRDSQQPDGAASLGLEGERPVRHAMDRGAEAVDARVRPEPLGFYSGPADVEPLKTDQPEFERTDLRGNRDSPDARSVLTAMAVTPIVREAEGGKAASATGAPHPAGVVQRAADTATPQAQFPVSRGVEQQDMPPETPVPEGVRAASERGLEDGLDVKSAEVRSAEFRPVEARVFEARTAEARLVEGRVHVPVQALPATLVTFAQTAPDGPVTITLSPEDLGALRFEMHGKGEAVHIALTVERPDTLDMLRRNAEQLIGEFRQAGFAAASFSFSGAWSGGREQASQRPHYRADEAEAEGPIRALRKQVGSGLDLRI